MAAVALLAACILVGTLATLAAPTAPAVAANSTNLSDKAPYYENESGNVSMIGWIDDGNASLDTIVGMAMRVGPYIIGTGEMDQSGTGFVGILLTGLLMTASALGAVAGVGIGAVGGTVVGLAVGFGLAAVGLAPTWIIPILLFGIGIAATVAARQVVRGP